MFLFGDGSTIGSDYYASASATGIYIGNAFNTANSFAAIDLNILDAYNSSKNTTIRSMHTHSPTVVQLNSGLWRNTAPPTSINISNTGNFQPLSRFSLYGVTA